MYTLVEASEKDFRHFFDVSEQLFKFAL